MLAAAPPAAAEGAVSIQCEEAPRESIRAAASARSPCPDFVKLPRPEPSPRARAGAPGGVGWEGGGEWGPGRRRAGGVWAHKRQNGSAARGQRWAAGLQSFPGRGAGAPGRRGAHGGPGGAARSRARRLRAVLWASAERGCHAGGGAEPGALASQPHRREPPSAAAAQLLTSACNIVAFPLVEAGRAGSGGGRGRQLETPLGRPPRRPLGRARGPRCLGPRWRRRAALLASFPRRSGFGTGAAPLLPEGEWGREREREEKRKEGRERGSEWREAGRPRRAAAPEERGRGARPTPEPHEESPAFGRQESSTSPCNSPLLNVTDGDDLEAVPRHHLHIPPPPPPPAWAWRPLAARLQETASSIKK
ncbi:uncharacterized protein LOC141496544 [Macrotis lagotis]|uniref:uncharacterized protein LOC141496544 n=1 Tax=Macrotis lagotis TaxID=92651 RepID=UPI003D69039C